MPVPETSRLDMGRCVCGAALAPAAFRDRTSYEEAHVSGLCQECQDLASFGRDDDGLSLAIHDGALVAVRAPGKVSELALLPFRFVLPGPNRARLAWEARFITRAGPWMDRLDVRCELEPMRPLLARHQVRASEHREFDASEVCDRLASLHLLVGLEQCALEAVAGVCRIPDRVARASLAEEVPWVEAFGRGLRSLHSWRQPEPGEHSTVRKCALMASLLLEQGRDGLRPLDYLLAGRRALFEGHSDDA